MTTQQRTSWRVFTVTVALVAAFAGYVAGVLTTDATTHTTAWHQGYNAALTDTVGAPQ